MPYHLNFNVVKRFVNVCSKMSANQHADRLRIARLSLLRCFSSASHSHCDAPERNYAADILIKYMTHELAEIRSAVYCSIAMLVAVGTLTFEHSRSIEHCRAACAWRRR